MCIPLACTSSTIAFPFYFTCTQPMVFSTLCRWVNLIPVLCISLLASVMVSGGIVPSNTFTSANRSSEGSLQVSFRINWGFVGARDPISDCGGDWDCDCDCDIPR